MELLPGEDPRGPWFVLMWLFIAWLWGASRGRARTDDAGDPDHAEQRDND